MSVLSKLTVTPLLYACGALLALSIGLGIALKVKAGQVSTAQAVRDTAIARRDTAITEREAWKRRAGELSAANRAYGNAVTGLQSTLTECQGENLRISAEGQRAIVAAQADARDADRTLKAFTAKFQNESRKPTCARALEALGASCPLLEGY